MELKSVTKKENNIADLEVSIDKETFAQACDQAYKKARKNIAVPGFRKGKAPKKMIETMYGKGVFYDDALDICYPEAAQEAIDKSELDYVGVDNVDVKKIDEDGVEFVLSIVLKPEGKIEDYKGLKATATNYKVTDDEIDHRIWHLRERNARMIPVEDRAVENGDIVTIDYEGFADGKAFEGGKAEEYDLEIGSGSFIPGFEDAIVGHNIDEEFDINVTFPEEYGSQELAGKDATFKIKLHSIKRKEIPEFDDDFVQDVTEDCDTADQLKEKTGKEIEEDKKNRQESEIQDQLFAQLAENLEADVPDVMVENEIDNQIRDVDYRLRMQGADFKAYLEMMGATEDVYREYARDNALKSVKIRLALEAIVKAENLEITEEELNEKYEEYAKQYNMELDKTKEVIPEKTLRADMAVEKAVKLVRDSAEITYEDPKEPEEHDHDHEGEEEGSAEE